MRQFLRLLVNGFRTGGQLCAQFGALRHGLEQPNGVKVRGKDKNAGKHDRYERSEEHTSELQSRSDLVCRLLLEKKKKNKPKYASDDLNIHHTHVPMQYTRICT